jgi:hypothetical protein
VKCGLETAPVTADASTESAVPRSQATRQSLPVSLLHLAATRAGEPAAVPLRRRWNWRGTLCNWGYKRHGGRNITLFRDWLAQPRRC